MLDGCGGGGEEENSSSGGGGGGGKTIEKEMHASTHASFSYTTFPFRLWNNGRGEFIDRGEWDESRPLASPPPTCVLYNIREGSEEIPFSNHPKANKRLYDEVGWRWGRRQSHHPLFGLC